MEQRVYITYQYYNMLTYISCLNIYLCIYISIFFLGKGDMDYILESVPFTNCDEEPRLHAIIEDLIKRGEVPEYTAFTNENDKKKQRRKRKVRY